MIDWERAERHARYHRIATWVRIISALAMVNEIFSIIAYHWPLWADIALPITTIIHFLARFVQKHTEMYRVDI